VGEVSVSALMVLGGLVVLLGGGELLVRGSSGLARSLGLSPLVIGLTVVAFATSAPEFAVTLGATISGEPDLAVGNVVGSNIVNVLLILGASALVIPLAVASRVVRRDVPVMLALSVAALVLALDGQVSALDGVVLIGVLAAYTVTTVVGARRETGGQRAERETAAASTPVWRDVGVALAGVVLLVAGAQSLVTGATDIAQALQVSTAVIGLTVVAIGTSLPELATSVVAAMRGERDIAIGNIVGSNIFNLGAVLGLSAVLSADGVPVAASIIAVDLPLMVAAALALLPVAITGFRMARAEGALFVLLYAAYTAYLVLDSTGHDALTGFTTVMLWFVLPLVAATLTATLVFELRRRRRQSAAPHPGPHPADPSP
jgi:cation:H+ antiporter